jgi:shikimate 5-dehydrogenase
MLIDFFSTRLASARASLPLFSKYDVNLTSVETPATTSIDLLINATSMNFQTDCKLQLDLSHTICYDLNYGVRHTPFSEWAKKNNAHNIYDGLGMLTEQGRMSFYQWLGKMPK